MIAACLSDCATSRFHFGSEGWTRLADIAPEGKNVSFGWFSGPAFARLCEAFGLLNLGRNVDGRVYVIHEQILYIDTCIRIRSTLTHLHIQTSADIEYVRYKQRMHIEVCVFRSFWIVPSESLRGRAYSRPPSRSKG